MFFNQLSLKYLIKYSLFKDFYVIKRTVQKIKETVNNWPVHRFKQDFIVYTLVRHIFNRNLQFNRVFICYMLQSALKKVSPKKN